MRINPQYPVSAGLVRSVNDHLLHKLPQDGLGELGVLLRDFQKALNIDGPGFGGIYYRLWAAAWVGPMPQNQITRKIAESKTTEVQQISVVFVRPEGFETPVFWSAACPGTYRRRFSPRLTLFGQQSNSHQCRLLHCFQ